MKKTVIIPTSRLFS